MVVVSGMFMFESRIVCKARGRGIEFLGKSGRWIGPTGAVFASRKRAGEWVLTD